MNDYVVRSTIEFDVYGKKYFTGNDEDLKASEFFKVTFPYEDEFEYKFLIKIGPRLYATKLYGTTISNYCKEKGLAEDTFLDANFSLPENLSRDCKIVLKSDFSNIQACVSEVVNNYNSRCKKQAIAISQIKT